MLPDLGFKVLVFTAESLARNVVWIELFDFLIIKAEPRLIILALPVLDIAVVMASLRSTSMYDDALELELVVRIGKLAVEDDLLLLCEIFHCQALFIHLFDQLVARDDLLAVGTHVEFHREATVIIDFEFSHGIVVELEASKHQEEHVG